MEFIPGPYPGQAGHPVTVGSFKVEKYEIAFEKFAEVRDWGRANGYSDLAFGQNGSTPTTTNNPVTMVNWYQAVKWCNARSEKDGSTPVYYTSSALTTVYRTGTLDLGSDAVKWTANGYRLPTEAEWEFAARGGKTGTNWYSRSSKLGDVAWNWTNSGNHTHQVGTKPPNELGIYDIPVMWTNGAGIGMDHCPRVRRRIRGEQQPEASVRTGVVRSPLTTTAAQWPIASTTTRLAATTSLGSVASSTDIPPNGGGNRSGGRDFDKNAQL